MVGFSLPVVTLATFLASCEGISFECLKVIVVRKIGELNYCSRLLTMEHCGICRFLVDRNGRKSGRETFKVKKNHGTANQQQQVLERKNMAHFE